MCVFGTDLNEIMYDVHILKSDELFPEYSFARDKKRCVYIPQLKKVVNFCSENYSLIKNNSFLQIYEFLTHKYGSSMIKTYYEAIDHSKFYITMEINNQPYQVKKDDIVNPSIEIYNSYDGKLKHSLKIGFQRVVCSNGMMAFESMLHASRKHRGSNQIDSLEIDFDDIEITLNQVDQQLDRFKQLSERRLLPKELDLIKENVKENTDFPRRQLSSFDDIIKKEMIEFELPATAWLAYNAYNNILNHSDLKIHREFKAKIDKEVLREVKKVAQIEQL